MKIPTDEQVLDAYRTIAKLFLDHPFEDGLSDGMRLLETTHPHLKDRMGDIFLNPNGDN